MDLKIRLKILLSYNVCLYTERYDMYLVYLYMNRVLLDSDRCFDSVLFISPSLARRDSELGLVQQRHRHDPHLWNIIYSYFLY